MHGNIDTESRIIKSKFMRSNDYNDWHYMEVYVSMVTTKSTCNSYKYIHILGKETNACALSRAINRDALT